MVAGTIQLEGRRFVIVPEDEYDALVSRRAGDALPPMPKAGKDGTIDALAYSRASIARDVIRGRQALGLSQAELARRAGIRPETLNRIERCKTAPAQRILERLDAALRVAERRARTK